MPQLVRTCQGTRPLWRIAMRSRLRSDEVCGTLVRLAQFAKAPNGDSFYLNKGSQPMAKQQPKNKPERVIRIGYVSASVFVQTGGEAGNEREFRTVSLQRSYLDDDGKRQYTGSLSLGDLPNAIRALQLVQAHVESKEAEVVG